MSLVSASMTTHSWISFLISPDVIPGRMGLLITLLLVLVNLFNSIKDPPATSPSALDVWILSCVFFVTLALIAYASLLYLKTAAAAFNKKQTMNSAVDIKRVFETRTGSPKPQLIKMKQKQRLLSTYIIHIASRLSNSGKDICYGEEWVNIKLKYFIR